MKKIILPLFILICISSFAQDIKITKVSPAGDSRLKGESSQDFVVTIEAITPVPSGTIIGLDYAWNLEMLKASGGAQILNFELAATKKMKLYCTITTPKESTDSVSLTFRATLSDDPNQDNNYYGSRYLITNTLERDLEVAIVSPTSGTEIKNWTTVEYTLDITNVGIKTFKSGTHMLYEVLINNESKDGSFLIVYDGKDLKEGETGQITLDVQLPRTLPNAASVNLCLPLCWAEFEGPIAVIAEDDIDNNKACDNYNVLVNSLNENILALNKLYYNNGLLNVELFNNKDDCDYRFDIISINGQQVVSTTYRANEYSTLSAQIAMNRATKGLYIVRIYANDEIVGTTKFFVH